MSNLKRNIAKFKLIRNLVEKKGFMINDTAKCIFCSKCEKVCPVAAIAVDKNSKKWTIENNICIRCQKCVKVCPVNALSLKK